MKYALMVFLTLFSLSASAHGGSGGHGSGGSGTGAMPSSAAQVTLRAGYEACHALRGTTAEFNACMAKVYDKVVVENRKASL